MPVPDESALVVSRGVRFARAISDRIAPFVTRVWTADRAGDASRLLNDPEVHFVVVEVAKVQKSPPITVPRRWGRYPVTRDGMWIVRRSDRVLRDRSCPRLVIQVGDPVNRYLSDQEERARQNQEWPSNGYLFYERIDDLPALARRVMWEIIAARWRCGGLMSALHVQALGDEECLHGSPFPTCGTYPCPQIRARAER